MNWEQVKGIVERIATIGVSYAVGKGWIPSDVASNLIMAIVALGAVGWGIWVNTPKALSDATKKVGG